MSIFAAVLAEKQQQYTYALARYQQAEPNSKLQLSRWEMLRWAVDALNVVLTATEQEVVALPPAPWALTPQQVFEASYASQ